MTDAPPDLLTALERVLRDGWTLTVEWTGRQYLARLRLSINGTVTSADEDIAEAIADAVSMVLREYEVELLPPETVAN